MQYTGWLFEAAPSPPTSTLHISTADIPAGARPVCKEAAAVEFEPAGTKEEAAGMDFFGRWFRGDGGARRCISVALGLQCTQLFCSSVHSEE